MANIDLTKYLPSSLSTEFWVQFLEALSEELNEYRQENIDIRKDYFDLYVNGIESFLVDLIALSGYPVNRIIDQSNDFLRDNLVLTPYRIQNKANYRGYRYIYNIINYIGNVYNLYYRDLKLYRGVDTDYIETQIPLIDYSKPFTDIKPLYFYDSEDGDVSTLDQDFPGATLDSELGLQLDFVFRRNPTNWLSMEYCINKLFTKDTKEYLMHTDLLDYLSQQVEYNRKVDEFPHNGFNVSFITDDSGYYNNLSLDADYSIPDLNLQCGLTSLAFSAGVSVKLDALTEEESMTLDKERVFLLDQGMYPPKITGDTEFDFYTAKVGYGNKKIISKDYPTVNNDLILYCSFDGDDLLDSTHNNKHLEVIEGTVDTDYDYEVGTTGKALHIIPLNRIKIQSQKDILLFNTDKAFSFFFRWNDLYNTDATGVFLASIKGTADSLIRFDYIKNNQTILFTFKDTITYEIPFVNDNNFHNITVNIDKDTANQVEVFLDGVSVFTSDITAYNIEGAVKITIGYDDDDTKYLTGAYIDDIRLYNRILDTDDINQIVTYKVGDYTVISDIYQPQDALIESVNEYTIGLDTWYLVLGRLSFQDATTDFITFNEVGIYNRDNYLLVYASFPECYIRKDNHFSFQFLIKKTT